MAAEDVAPTTEPVPQATGNTLPGIAGDLADVTKAPSAEDALLEANFGARGAQQYRDLRTAGQATGAAPVAAPPASSPLDALVGGGASAPAPTPAYNQPSELAAGGIARALQAFGNPQMAAQQQQAQQAQILAATKAKQASSMELFSLIPTAFKQFEGRPDLAGAFLANEAQQRGVALTPAVAMYINQKIADGKMTLEDIEKVMVGADLNTMQRYGTSLRAWSDVLKAQAETSTAIAEAAAAPEAAKQAAQKKALDIANALRTAQRPPTQNEVETLDAAGLEAYQVPVPGYQGGMMWSTRPKGSGGSGVVDPAKLKHDTTRNPREQQFLKAAREQLQKEVDEGKRASFGEVDVMNTVEGMRAAAEAQKTEAVKGAGLVAEGRALVARGLDNVQQLINAVEKLDLAEGPAGAAWQPFEFVGRMASRDPTYATINAFPATLSNIARSLGEKGVLTETDVSRINAALGVGWFDTKDTYKARTDFVKEAMRRGQQALEDAARTGKPVVKPNLNDLTYEGDPLPPNAEQRAAAAGGGTTTPTSGAAPTGGGGTVSLQDWLTKN